MRTMFSDMGAESGRFGWGNTGLGILAGGVDLDVDIEFCKPRFCPGGFLLLRVRTLIRLLSLPPPFLQFIGFLGRVHTAHTKQIRDVAGKWAALVRLQRADEVPADGSGRRVWRERGGRAQGGVDGGLLLEFLKVVFAEVEVDVGSGVEGEDIVDGFELGDGYETDLGRGVRPGSGEERGGDGGVVGVIGAGD